MGGILQWVPLAVSAAVLVPYMWRSRRVRVLVTSPKWLPGAFLAWYVAIGNVLPGLLDDTVDYAYTAGGILAAAPVLWWAERLRRRT